MEHSDPNVASAVVWPNRYNTVDSYDSTNYCLNQTAVSYVNNRCGNSVILNMNTGNVECCTSSPTCNANLSLPFWQKILVIGGSINASDGYYIIDGGTAQHRLVPSLTYVQGILVKTEFDLGSTAGMAILPPFPTSNASLASYPCVDVRTSPSAWLEQLYTNFGITADSSYNVLSFTNYLGNVNINPIYVRTDLEYYQQDQVIEIFLSSFGGVFTEIMSGAYFFVYATRFVVEKINSLYVKPDAPKTLESQKTESKEVQKSMEVI